MITILHAPTGRHGGWRGPPPEHILKGLRAAGPEAGDSILAGIVAQNVSDNSSLLPVPLDQGNLGSCTANAVAAMLYCAFMRAGVVPVEAARLALYYWPRLLSGDELRDTGTWIGSVVDQVALHGVPPEAVWPYDVVKFASKPGPAVDMAAADTRGRVGVEYHPLSTTGDTMIGDVERACTAGYPVAFGVQVSQKFCSERPTEIVQAPGSGDAIAGGHALLAFDHNRGGRYFRVLNSWGPDWGDPSEPPGIFRISYDYMKQSSDRWITLAAPVGAL